MGKGNTKQETKAAVIAQNGNCNEPWIFFPAHESFEVTSPFTCRSVAVVQKLTPLSKNKHSVSGLKVQENKSKIEFVQIDSSHSFEK